MLKSVSKNAVRCWNIVILLALCLLLNCTMAQAAATLVTDKIQWEAMVSEIEVFVTTADKIVLADEAYYLPGLDEQLGSTLTFQTSNTGMSRGFVIEALETGAGLTFDDDGATEFEDALSVGDIDAYEDDDWQLSLLDGASMMAFGVEIRHSDFAPGEAITLYSGANAVGTVDLSLLPATGNNNYFIGIISDVPFDRIVFDEDSDGDDIAIADFRFAIVTSCPLSVRIAGTTPVYYSSLQAAYDNADGGETIQSHDAVFTEDIAFDLDKSVFFEGGYDCDYTSVTGKTTVYGNMSVSNGMVTIQNGMLEAQ